MSRKNLTIGLVSMLSLVVLVLGVRTVYAHCGICLTDAKYFAGALDNSEMSLAKAARAAEKDTKGRAVHATVMRVKDGEGVNIEVHVLANEKIMAVLVDGQSGKVLKKKEVPNLEGHAS